MPEKKFESVAEALENTQERIKKEIKVEQKDDWDTYHEKNPLNHPDYKKAYKDLERAHEKFWEDILALGKKLNLTDGEHNYFESYIHDDTRKL